MMKTILGMLLLLTTFTVMAQRPSALEHGKFFTQDGDRMLFGGENSSQHFIINNLDLKKDQFHYGLGRERFPALIAPEFITVQDADVRWKDQDRFLVAYKGDEVKAYAVKDLTRHEVVNDLIDGTPIFAAYCILADLGAIYKRTYGDKVFTFGVSGYTYYDPKVWHGMDGFILWDRETESLWWPLIDKAVSGPLKGVPLLKLEDVYWDDISWSMVKQKYPEARVLKSGQDFMRPDKWHKYEDVADIKANYSN